MDASSYLQDFAELVSGLAAVWGYGKLLAKSVCMSGASEDPIFLVPRDASVCSSIFSRYIEGLGACVIVSFVAVHCETRVSHLIDLTTSSITVSLVPSKVPSCVYGSQEECIQRPVSKHRRLHLSMLPYLFRLFLRYHGFCGFIISGADWREERA